MLPMLFQMPIWVALYSAIDASISLRGAKFLPFWITDLSAPDAIFSFPQVNLILLSFSSLNLLADTDGCCFLSAAETYASADSAAAIRSLPSSRK